MDFFTPEVMAEIDYHIRAATNVFLLPRSMREDIKSELFLAITENLKAYDQKQSSPKTFAGILCSRKILDLARYYRRRMRNPQNELFSLDEKAGGEKELFTWGEIIPQPEEYSLATMFSSYELLESVKTVSMSVFEERILRGLLEGYSSKEIARKNSTTKKIVRNRRNALLQKVRAVLKGGSDAQRI